MHISHISSPNDYYNIQRLFLEVKKNALGYYKTFDRTKRFSEQTRKLQQKFKQTLNIISNKKPHFPLWGPSFVKKKIISLFYKGTKQALLHMAEKFGESRLP